MEKNRILIPGSIDLNNSLSFSVTLPKIEESKTYIFDFRNANRIEPFGMLLISSEITRFKKTHPTAEFKLENYEHMSYAAHMGFFKAFGFDFGKYPGEASGNSNYMPITIIDCKQLEIEAVENRIAIGDRAEEEGKKISTILCGESEGDLHDTLSYSVREMIRNVIEHSQSKQFGICAQYWPSQNKVEVAILDRGIGLQKSLSANPHLDVSSNKNSINYALMPAVSGKAFKGTRVKQSGPWANSGFGLYMTNRLCTLGGNFFISTGDTGMLLTKSEGKRYFECDFQGTAIRMVMRTDRQESLKDALAKFRKEGSEIQSRYKEIVKIDPSSASLMLSEDFDLSTWDKLLVTLKLRQ